MASSMAAMLSSSAALGGVPSLVRGAGKSYASGLNAGVSVRIAVNPGFVSRRGLVRCDVGDNVQGVKEVVDKASKKEISREEIVRNQQQNTSEMKSVLGAKPNSGSFYPRPETERRPETGPRDLGSIFAFDGAAPETINGRLAMIGIVWAALAEKMSGLTVFEQLYTSAGGLGLVYYVAVVQIITFASLIPFLNGESTDARSFGPFRAQAERWNGRLAMLGFLSLLLTEQFTHTAVFSTWF